MCQLNVYMIDKYVSGVDVKEIFHRHHHHSFENINEEVVIKNYDDDYNYYEASHNKCDCGSVIGFLSNSNTKCASYIEYLESCGKEEIAKLYKIKKMLLKPDYEEKLNSTLQYRDTMFSKLENYALPIKEKEAILSELTLKTTPNLKDQIKIKQLESELKALKSGLDNNEEYKMLKLSYNDYIDRNSLLIASQNYTLEFKKDWWQENIDMAINKAEANFHQHVNAEFNHLKFILNDILKLTDEVKLFSFWQNDAKQESDYFNSINEVSSTTIDELSLDDLVFLNYKDVITIKK